MTKKLLLASVVTVFAASGACAADLVEPAVYDWTGPYIGLNAGVGIGDSSVESILDGAFVGDPFYDPYAHTFENDKVGFTGGVTAGYNWQIDNFVLGLEGDFNYLDSKDSESVRDPLPVNLDFETKIDWFATVRPRLGLAFESILLYITGGLAIGDVSSDVDVNDSGSYSWSGSQSKTALGWTIGGGGEWAFSDGWSIKAEYLWVDLGSDTFDLDNDPANPLQEYTLKAKADYQFSVARVGLNFRF